MRRKKIWGFGELKIRGGFLESGCFRGRACVCSSLVILCCAKMQNFVDTRVDMSVLRVSKFLGGLETWRLVYPVFFTFHLMFSAVAIIWRRGGSPVKLSEKNTLRYRFVSAGGFGRFVWD